jgi:hypothetical protein
MANRNELLPTPVVSTGLCRLCGGDAALPGSDFCGPCQAEIFRCNVCECGGQCDQCRGMLDVRERLSA